MPQSIFISYRRNDSQGMAGRIYDYLLRHFPAAHLFFDVDNIPPGENFETSVVNAVSQCHTMLVIIGPRWQEEINRHAATAPGKDWVELEITTAIRQNIRIIPLLLEDTRMPEQEELPSSLQTLSLKNAFSVRHVSFGIDMKKLVTILKTNAQAEKKTITVRPGRLKAFGIAAIGLLVLLTAGYFLLNKKQTTRDKVIAFLDDQLNSAEAKKMESWFGQSGALRVPKTAKLLYQIPVAASDSFTQKEEQYINDLVYKGLISVKTLRDEVLTQISVKDLEISLTDKGKQYLIGETMREYYLNAFDFGKVQILEMKENGDTVIADVKINGIKNKTAVYDLITDDYKQKIEKDLETTITVKMLRTKGGFRLLNNEETGKQENADDQATETSLSIPCDTASVLLEGEATNLVSNNSSGIMLCISEQAGGSYTCSGSFDNKKLFGKFELTGEEKKDASSAFTKLLSFTGFIILGENDGSQYTPGTKATLTIHLSLSSTMAVGTYQVGEIPNSSWSDTKQNGTLKLNIK